MLEKHVEGIEKTAYAAGPSPHVPPARPPIKLLLQNLPVQKLHEELLANPGLWNLHGARTEQYAHAGISDIWVRYNDEKNYDGDLAKFNESHEPVWYPAFDALPSSVEIIFNVMRYVMAERLGGVLITKIPAGCSVKPHVDLGWHASYYQKFAVQIAADDDQAFCFDEMQLITAPGDMYTFDNQKLHWVENDGKTDRITMIICLRCGLDWLEEGD